MRRNASLSVKMKLTDRSKFKLQLSSELNPELILFISSGNLALVR